MNKVDPRKITAYWKKTAVHDYETMRALFKTKRYSDTLFFGHIVLEKNLKAIVVRHTGQHAPFTHDLTKLAEIAELNLTKEEIIFLDEMNKYNIRARYPDYKLKIYKLCTKEYTQIQLNKVEKLYIKLCEMK